MDLLAELNLKEVFSVTLILFAVIDILGSIPFILNLRKRYQNIDAFKITLVSGILLFVFLYVGQSILKLFGVDVQSFAIAGGLIMFFLGLEMVLNIEIFKHDPQIEHSSPIVPLAFPLIAGAGSMTTLISLNSQYAKINIILGLILNLIFVYAVLKASDHIDRAMGVTGSIILRKFFGTILLAMSIKLIRSGI